MGVLQLHSIITSYQRFQRFYVPPCSSSIVLNTSPAFVSTLRSDLEPGEGAQGSAQSQAEALSESGYIAVVSLCADGVLHRGQSSILAVLHDFTYEGVGDKRVNLGSMAQWQIVVFEDIGGVTRVDCLAHSHDAQTLLD